MMYKMMLHEFMSVLVAMLKTCLGAAHVQYIRVKPGSIEVRRERERELARRKTFEDGLGMDDGFRNY